jgi:small subunit ribosomal protein S5
MGVRSLSTSTNSEGGSKKKGAAKGASTSGRGKKEKDSKITEAELVGADVVENKKEKKPKSTKAKKEEKGDEVPVPPMGRVDSAALLKLESDDQDFERKSSQKKWPHKIISIRRTAKITKAGVLNSFSAFLIVGNKKGLIGYGKGKSNEAKKAVERAYQNAMNNLIAIELFEGHTIYHDVEHRFKKTKVNLWAEKQGSGVIANELVSTICDLAGIQNLRAKVHGVHHKRNTVRAIFEALELVESVEEMRRARGADLRLY